MPLEPATRRLAPLVLLLLTTALPAQWNPLASGDANGAVQSLAVVSGGPADGLYAAGTFSNVNGVSNTNRIARWDGVSWHAVGTGGGFVEDLGVFGGALVADAALGGSSANVSRWNGTSWTGLGGGVVGDVQAFLEVNPSGIPGAATLIAGGTITAVLNSPGGIPIPTNFVAQWNDITSTWSPVGAGTSNVVNTLAFHAGQIYAAGPSGILQVFSGGLWTPVGGGIFGVAEAMVSFSGELWVAGTILSAGGVSVQNVARWNAGAGTWSPAGVLPNGISSLVVHDDGTGATLWAAQRNDPTGNRVYRLDQPSMTWEAVGDPFGPAGSSDVLALASRSGELIAGGTFTANGATALGRLARLFPVAFPGSLEDLELLTGINSDPLTDLDLKQAATGDFLGISLRSPGGTFSGRVPGIVGTVFPTGMPPAPIPGFPEAHLDLQTVIVLFDGNDVPGFFSAFLLPADGLNLGGVVPPGLGGLSLLLQGLALSPTAANGFFASTNGHEFRF